MALGSRNRERFWIALIVRFAFGFMFLIASINIFFSGWQEGSSFKENFQQIGPNLTSWTDLMSKPYEETWINIKIHSSEVDAATGAPAKQTEVGMMIVRGFLYAMPFIFLVLSLFILTGLFYRMALRLSALFLVMLGLGKYLVDFKTGTTLVTLQDFMYAMFITMALFVLSREDSSPQGEEA